jgi:glucose/arabinose dehydrogenase
MKNLKYLALVLVAAASLSAGVIAQGVPAPFTTRLQTWATGLSRPILLRHAGDGSKRIFVVQQAGIIRVFQPGATSSTDFINLSSRVTQPGSAGDERGLLGMAFHPNFANNGKFYVNYTQVGTGTTIVSEYTTTSGNGNSNTGNFNSERILLTIPQPFTNHNGGMIEFGPDGYLYIATGDGGSANDPGNRAQNRSLLLGKLLRIDVNSTSPAYLIPPTNPYQGSGTARCDNGSTTAGTLCQEIYSFGLRNPWRFSFDRQMNEIWLADVGQGAQEEVNLITAPGGNYGWRVYEGTACTGLDPGLCIPSNFTMPLFTYARSGGRCSITGGYVYRGKLGSLPNGAYVYADYCTGEVIMRNGGTTTILHDTPRLIVSYGEDEDGEIYVCYSNGQIDKIVRAKAAADLDGDLRTDLSVYRPQGSFFYSVNSSNLTTRGQQFGLTRDLAAPGDFDGDNITDIAVFRPSSGDWFVFRSSDNTVMIGNWGVDGDRPVVGDYDGDAKADHAIYRPSTGQWYIYRSSDFMPMVVPFGLPSDTPMPADYDGDGKTDIGVYRADAGSWFTLNSANGAFNALSWGLPTDVPAVGDFDGDGRADVTVFRPSTGTWYTRLSTTGAARVTSWGTAGDKPAAGDYDGDGRDDIAVYRPSNGVWYIIRSSNSTISVAGWGNEDDIPLPAISRK